MKALTTGLIIILYTWSSILILTQPVHGKSFIEPCTTYVMGYPFAKMLRCMPRGLR